jgi:predicted dehydrogenase
MSINTRISLGIVGANVRGESFKAVLDAIGAVRVHAVCDLDPGRAADAAGKLGPAEHYTDYEQMLDRARPDAVLIATPMPLHVTHAVSALQPST